MDLKSCAVHIVSTLTAMMNPINEKVMWIWDNMAPNKFQIKRHEKNPSKKTRNLKYSERCCSCSLLMVPCLIIAVVYHWSWIIDDEGSTIIYSRLRNITTSPRETTQWPGYRLADIFKYHEFRGMVTEIRKKWPESLAVEYVDKLIDPMHSGDAEFDVMLDIIRNRSTSPLIQSLLPDDHTLVIHLRTGDVIDNSRVSVSELWDCRVCGGGYNYTRGWPYFQEIWNEIQKDEIRIDRILLVTGWHKATAHSRSIEYINKVIEFMEGLVETVDIRLNEIPDEDVIITVNSKYFVLSGGGFSRMIAELVDRNGGRLFGNDTAVGRFKYHGHWVLQ